MNNSTRSKKFISKIEFYQMLEKTFSPINHSKSKNIIPSTIQSNLKILDDITLKSEKCIIFDVETTGFPNKIASLDNQPYITQLSFIVIEVYKYEKNELLYDYKVIKEVNNYIRIPENIAIPSKITELTGINNDLCNREGINIVDILSTFYNEYITSNYIVSHNIDFDSKMMLIELERNYFQLIKLGCITPFALFNNMFNSINNIKLYCTMTEGKHITNIYIQYKGNTSTTTSTNTNTSSNTQTLDKSKTSLSVSSSINSILQYCNNIEDDKCNSPTPKMYKKNPKLIELYKHLYPDNPIPANLHNSLVDTKVCMDCFLKMKYFI